MHVEQAIFTSVRNGRLDGYQLAAASPGVTRQEARELSRWGPAHDSLWDPRPGANSVNFHWLSSGLACVSRTTAAGAEYSGRGGNRIYTHCLLAAPALLSRFANHPFRLLEAADASGDLVVRAHVPDRLDALPLPGSGRMADGTRLAQVAHLLGPDKLAALLDAALTSAAVGFHAPMRAKDLLSGLLDLLPPRSRAQFSFSTGLRFSSGRSFRLVALPEDPRERRRTLIQGRLTLVDLTGDEAGELDARHGWARLMLDLLRARRLALLPKLLLAAEEFGQRDLESVAEQLRASFDLQADYSALPISVRN